MVKFKIFLTLVFLSVSVQIVALTSEVTCLSKLSSSLRTLLSNVDIDNSSYGKSLAKDLLHANSARYRVCAFVQVKDGGDEALVDNGASILAQFGDIVIADIPMNAVPRLSNDVSICRIEAERGNKLTLDSMVVFTDALPVYSNSLGTLPQAYTGQGVVMGIQDIGFDLTHPAFRSQDGRGCRIKRFWDQLSLDKSDMYVGADYIDETSILKYAHSRDGLTQYHGTHTLAIATGTGAGTIYKGMAPDADICLVANAVSSDEKYISEEDRFKYTYATDALGFKYIFDYAESQGKPCVISFSEGSLQDLHGDDMLYYEVLQRLTGPGHIIVASAGNEGVHNNYVGKPRGRQSAGCFITAWNQDAAFTVKGDDDYNVAITLYNIGDDVAYTEGVARIDDKLVIKVSPRQVAMCVDSVKSDTIIVNGVRYIFMAQAYRSCYNSEEWAMDVVIKGPKGLGYDLPMSVETYGEDSQVDMYLVSGLFDVNDINPTLNDADVSHSILSPSSAPAVVCAGGTACRPVYTNIVGDTISQSWGISGQRGYYSSVGPTMDGRNKPDVMAPGANVVSALSSFFMENKKQDESLNKNILLKQTYDGREYGWIALGGTSMSAPAVGGIIALWLQANPELTPQDVLGVISRTSRPCGDYGDETPNYCGSGMIDAYHGLLDILGLTAIGDISFNSLKGWNVNIGAEKHLKLQMYNVYDELLKSIDEVSVNVYNLSGKHCFEYSWYGDNVLGNNNDCIDMDLSHLPDGVYAVQVDIRTKESLCRAACKTFDKALSGSLLIRLVK